VSVREFSDGPTDVPDDDRAPRVRGWKFGSLSSATYTRSFRRGAHIEWNMKFDKDRRSLVPFLDCRPQGTLASLSYSCSS
jgi:hypothetical protein